MSTARARAETTKRNRTRQRFDVLGNQEASLSHLLLLPPPAPHPVRAGVSGGRHGFPLLQAGEGMQWASRRRRRQRRARPRGRRGVRRGHQRRDAAAHAVLAWRLQVRFA